MKRRWTSTKTSGICRVCGDECHPRRGQREAEHTEAMHYEIPWEPGPARMKELRDKWLAENLHNPAIENLLGQLATMTVYAPGELMIVPRGRAHSQVGGKVRLPGSKLREASGVFDFSGQSFTFIEDDGVIWEIDTSAAMDEKRLCAHLKFQRRAS